MKHKPHFSIAESDGASMVPLTQGQVALVDNVDIPLLGGHHWTALRNGNTWYAKAHVGNKTIYMHRLIQLGEEGLTDRRTVDHVNGNGLDNRRHNLRAVTHSQNLQNSLGRPRARKSAFKGVSLRKHPSKPYRACIEVNGRQKHLGYFASECDAATAYNDAALFHFGAHAHLNDLAGRADTTRAA